MNSALLIGSHGDIGYSSAAYLKGQQPRQIDGQQQSPEQMAQTIRQLHKEVEYLKRQREILKKAMSIVGEEPNPGMR